VARLVRLLARAATKGLFVSNAVRVLVIADTHGHLPPNLEALASGAHEIWHLGDVTAPSLLEAVCAVGPPVVIVRGNCDSNSEWPMTADLERNGVRFHLIHIPPKFAPAGVHVLLHGHTHVPRDEVRGDVRFLNPGCVRRPNRGAPASVAHLEISATGELAWTRTLLR